MPLQPILPFNPHPGHKVRIVGNQQQGARVVVQHLNKQLARNVIQMVVRLIKQQQIGQLRQRQHHQQAQFQPLASAQTMTRRQGASAAQGNANQPGLQLTGQHPATQCHRSCLWCSATGHRALFETHRWRAGSRRSIPPRPGSAAGSP